CFPPPPPPTCLLEQIAVGSSAFEEVLKRRAAADERDEAGEREPVDDESLQFVTREDESALPESLPYSCLTCLTEGMDTLLWQRLVEKYGLAFEASGRPEFAHLRRTEVFRAHAD
ncbi:MAG: hypothetical protein NT013_06490, partial [Planctomycetia bacterium]|nr:hypothetical protein [Planctomycetia bacterium]